MNTQADNAEVWNDFPKGLSQPALRALHLAGYTQLEQLTQVRADDLLKLHGMGPKGIRILREALLARGLSFAEENPTQTGTSSGERIYDSPEAWVRKHIQDYVESDGEKGHIWRGMSTLLLTTRGHKSGKLRRTALIYGQDGPNYLVVASNGGSPHHPLWYLNLAANPQVELQVGAEKISGFARTATPAEKPYLWKIMSNIFPTYDTYLVKAAEAGRDIPLVIVEPA